MNKYIWILNSVVLIALLFHTAVMLDRISDKQNKIILLQEQIKER